MPCLVPRLVSGPFRSRRRNSAIWPSTGNYCRGGVAISRILGCRGVAVLPEGMSRERFDWLEQWVADPADIIRTPGTESNVKEIYDKCAELARDPHNVILNQFSEFANYLIHYHLHRAARSTRVFSDVQARDPRLPARGLRLGHRLGRHHRRRRLPEEAARHEDRGGRGDRMPDHARATAMASTTSRASATSTSR